MKLFPILQFYKAMKTLLKTGIGLFLGIVIVGLGLLSWAEIADAAPIEGSFYGKGEARGAVFGQEQQADASLNFNHRSTILGDSISDIYSVNTKSKFKSASCE